MELDDEDDEHQPPLLPPDDRLWRHPSEVASHGLPGGRRLLPRRDRGGAKRGGTPWGSFLSGAIGAVLVIGMVTVVGGFRTREVPVRSIERIAGPPVEAVAPDARYNEAVPAIVDEIRSAMVGVRAERAEGVLNSSGFIFRDDGYILTSARVVQSARRVWVTLSDASRHLASIIGVDPDTAVAVLKVDREPLTGATLGSAVTLRAGQTAIAVGTPTWTDVGVVSAVGREVRSKESPLLVDMIEVSMRAEATASGGPLLDGRGAVIGVLTVHGDKTYATPIEIARKVADELIRTGEVVYPWLGVEGEDTDSDLANKLAITGGALVTEVEADSPASLAALRPGDVIVAVEAVPIGSMGALKLELRNRRPGEPVTIHFIRDGQRQAVNATLVSKPF